MCVNVCMSEKCEQDPNCVSDLSYVVHILKKG